MIKNTIFALLGFAFCFPVVLLLKSAFPEEFYSMRLIEILNLLFPILLGSLIAFHFSRKLNNIGKKRELACASIDYLERGFCKLANSLNQFMKDTNSVKPIEITLSFKNLSSKITILEKHRDQVGLNKEKLANVRKAFETLNDIVTGDTWGQDPSKITYEQSQCNNVEREIKSIHVFLEELRYSLYD